MDIELTRLRLITEARSLARRLGIIGPLRRVVDTARRFRGKVEYEDRFNAALLSAIRSGDVVLDVGANLGLYSKKFLDLVGLEGAVYSIEPVPTCFSVLEAKCADYVNSVRFPFALGDKEAKVTMALDGDPHGATHSLVNPALQAAGKGSIDVRVLPGDQLIQEKGLRTPNVIKIDVEGFEEEVLNGLASTLQSPACRAVFVEVHFALLEAKGAKTAPLRIKKSLESLGYAVRWTDSSHLAALRASA